MDTRTESADPGQTRCQLARRPEEQKQKECRTPASGERARSFHDTFSRAISLGCVLSFARSRLRMATMAPSLALKAATTAGANWRPASRSMISVGCATDMD